MKKFFGIGLLALLTTAYFTSSCSRDEFSGSMIDAKKEAFSSVFIDTYGEPDPQHTWGFGVDSYSRAFTRAAEPRANEWAATYKVPAPLTEGQKNRVMKYFQYNQYPGGTTMNYSNYFVQQVYKGGYKPLGNSSNNYSTETYLAANQTTYITGGNNMDKLTAGTQHEHVNNFNYGDCGWNNDVLDNDQPINNGTKHSDQIMLMLNTPTTCMGYWNSNATYGHDDRYRLVSAEEIDRWASQNADKLDDVDAAVNDDWHRDFVGFDFSQVPSDQILVKTNEQYDENWVLVDYDLVYATIDDGPKTYEYIWDGTQTIKITEENRAQYLYLKNAQSQRIPFLDNKRNMYCGYERKKDDVNSSFYFTETAQYTAGAANNSSIELTNVPYTHAVDGGGTQTDNVTALNLKFINKMIGDGYYPIQENFRTWVAPRDCADGYYSDWIVSLVRAETKNGGGDDPSGNFDTFDVQEIIDGRIFCEDLGSAEATDIDYNDVVFDAFTYVTKTYKVPYTLDSNNKKVYDMTNISSRLQSTTYNKTDINLLAAGGTITIKVAGQDVNQLLGIDKTIMANTYVEGVSPNRSRYSNFSNGVSPVKFTVDNSSYTDLSNIPVAVRYDNEVRELTAYIGDVPQKFSAPVGTPWPAERVEFNSGFEGFQTWVNNRYATPWYTYVPDKLYNLKFASSSIRTVGGRITDAPTGNDAITVEGKGNNPGEEKFITVSLESTLAVGDQIAITGYRNRDDNAIGSLYLKFGDYIIKDEQVYNNKKYGSEPNTFVWTVTSDMAGCTSFQISRNKTGTNVYITDITIIGGFGAQDVDNNGGGNSNGNGGNNNGNTNGGGSGDDDAPDFGTLTGTEVAVNTTTLSSNSNLTVSASDISNTPAATVYVYGTGDGSVSVNGVEATTVNTRAATGVVKSCTLTPAQMGLNGLSITGGNFTVYRLSYQATTLPSVSQPAGTLLFGGNGQSKNMANWGDNQLKVAGSNLSGLTKNSKIRVAGIGFGQGNVQIDVEYPWQVIQNQTYTTNSAVGEVSVEFELTTEQQAKDLLAGGLVVQGNNFILKYVTVENPSSTGGGGTATATINLVTSANAITALNSSATKIVTDASTGRNYANRIVGGTTRLVGKATINADEKTYGYWNFKIGPGNSGDGILPEISNNLSEYSGWKQNDVVNINLLLTQELKDKIVKAVGKDGEYWPGGMITFQGHNVTLTELKLTNCQAAE